MTRERRRPGHRVIPARSESGQEVEIDVDALQAAFRVGTARLLPFALEAEASVELDRDSQAHTCYEGHDCAAER